MLPGGDLRAHLERGQGQQQRRKADHAGGGDLAADNGTARPRRGQQRLQRLPLTLAGGGVHYQVGTTEERGEGQQDRQQRRQHQATLGFGTGHVLAGHVQRPCDLGVDAPRHQPQRPYLPVVRGQRRLQARSGHLGGTSCAVTDHLHQRRLAIGPVPAEVRADAQRHVDVLRTDGLGQVLRRSSGIQALGSQEAHQVRRMFGADGGNLQRLLDLRAHAAFGQLAHAQDQQRVQQWPEQQGQRQRTAVARQVTQLLAHHLHQGRHHAHACRPSSLPISFTNASSRLDSPDCARSSSALPAAITVPLAMITM